MKATCQSLHCSAFMGHGQWTPTQKSLRINLAEKFELCMIFLSDVKCFLNSVVFSNFQASLIVYQKVSGFKIAKSKPPCDQNILTDTHHIFFNVSKLTKSGSKKANQRLGPDSQLLLHKNFL